MNEGILVRNINILYTIKLLVAFYFLIYFYFFQLIAVSYDFLIEKEIDFAIAYKNMIPNTHIIALVFVVLVFFLVVVIQVTFQKKRPQIRTPSADIIVSKVKEVFKEDISIFLTHYHSTYLSKEGIYLSTHDANYIFNGKKDLMKFILYHELFHYKILDPYVGKLQNILSSLIMFFFIMIMSGHLQQVFNELKYIEITSIALSIALVWKINEFYSLRFLRAKECFCDNFAYKSTSHFVINSKVMESKDSNTHPDYKQRNACQKGDFTLMYTSLLSSNLIFYSFFVMYFTNIFITTLLYFALLLELVILLLTIILAVKYERIVSKIKLIITAIIVSAFLVIKVYFPVTLLNISFIILDLENGNDFMNTPDQYLLFFNNLMLILTITVFTLAIVVHKGKRSAL